MPAPEIPKKDFHKSATFMDYLHGEVDEEEAGAACRYEYARESCAMWEAAKEREALMREKKCGCERAALEIVARPKLNECNMPVSEWYQHDFLAQSFLCCESFPVKDWNELTDQERNKIQRYERRKVPPLFMPNVRSPLGRKGMVWAMHKKFKELAGKNEPVIEDVPPGKTGKPLQPVPAMALKSGSVYHCLFEVDFSEAPDHLSDRFLAWLKQSAIEKLWQGHKKDRTGKIGKPLRNQKNRQHRNALYCCLFDVNLSARKRELALQFKKWLALPENRKRLKRYEKQKRGKTGEWHDRLKDLAAWRLCREITKEPKAWRHANTYACKNRLKFAVAKHPYRRGDPWPFHNARATNKRPANQAPLFSDQSEASDAKREAENFLADWIPSEFKKPSLSPDTEKAFNESFKE
jgi:hypothetical protein